MGTGMVFDQEAQDKSGPFEIKEKDGCRGIACKISEAWHFGSEVRVAKQTVQILVGTAGPQPQAPDPSKTQRQPPFCIFSDKTLEDLCAKRPSNEEELLNVWGFGDVKVRKYGQDILHTIESVSSSQPSTSVPSTPAAAPASACDQQSSDERSLSKALMEVRSKLSEERSSLHPSRIFSNNMIAELCVKRPANQFLGEHWLPFANQMQELLQVKGFGEVKVREFGPDILHAIKAASPAAGERLEKGSGGTDVKGVLGWLMDKKSNRILHFEGPTASCGIELQANWQEKVVSTWSELRRAVRDTRDALLDRFMVLRVQGRIHVEEPLLLQRSVVLTGEPMDATLKEGSPPGELCGPASLGALGLELLASQKPPGPVSRGDLSRHGRKDYESMQHRYVVEGLTNKQENSRSRVAELLHRAAIRDPEICQGGENSQVFMEASMLPLVISFLFSGALIRCFEVCPLWFVVYYKTLDQVFSKIDKGFKQYYGQSLHLEYARTDWSPVHVAEAGIRIDRILIARVTSHHVNHCTKVSYGYAYKSGQLAEEEENNNNKGYEDKTDPFECSFKFDTFSRGTSRSFWIHKDICRFHGDETRVAATQNITPVCVNDRIEIAVNLFNAMGLVDVDRVRWRPLEIFPVQERQCPIEQELFDWYDLDSFQSQSVERLQIPDFFSVQLRHISTEYAGIDVAVSRTQLRADAQGVVPQADRILGSRFEARKVTGTVARLQDDVSRAARGVSVESGDATVVFWRLNLTLSSRDGSAVAKTASCMEVVSGRPVLVDCNLTASDDGTDAHEASESASTTGLWAGADTTVLMFGCSVTAARGAGVSLQGSACMVKCHVQRNLQGGVFVAEGGRLMAESCDINGNGHFSLVAGRGGGSAASAGPSSTRMSDVVHVDELHVESDDLVTEVVDVTGGSDDEDLVEVNKAGPPLYFHGYRRGRELGRGASGQVFVCHKKGDSSGGGGYAVKVVDLRRLHLQPNAEREEKKLSREVEILTRLPPHPNIVQLIDTFEDGDWFLLVLELVGGGDLYTVLTNREPPRLQEREAAFVVAQLVEGLSFLHSQGIIHRDMKLENVLVANERREKPLVFYTVKITDFGLSKAIGAGFSEARSTVGTRPYTAPEVLREDSHDFSSDLWCLGVLLFVLLAGHFPFNKIPTKQDELQHLVGKLKISDLSKSVLLGLLQLEPLKRLDLAGLARHEWICETIMEDEEEKPKRTRSVASASAVSAEARAGSAAVPPPKAEANSRAGSEENAKRSTGSAARSDWPRSRDGAATPNSANSATSQAPLPPPPPEAETQTATPEKPPPPPPPSPLSVPLPGQPVPALNSKRSMSMMFSHSEVLPSSLQQDVMQVHMVVPDRSWVIINKSGPQLKQISSTLGCQVRLISRKTVSEQRLVGDHRIVVIGTYYQCSVVQELVHGRMMQAQRAEGKEPTGEISVTLFVRAEAAGVVIGKQGWVLGRVRKQSGAKINLLREEVREAHLRSGHRRAGGDLSTSAAALAAAAAERSAGAQAVKDAVELGAVEWRGGDLERRHWMDSTRAAAESPPCLFAAAGTGVHSRQRRDQQRAAHGGPSGAFSSLRRSRRARCGAMLCHCLRRTAAVPVLPTVSGEKNLSRSIQVGRTDLTGSHAGSLWHCGGENSHVLLDQCSVSGSLAPNGAHVASPAVVASAYAMLTLWDCFAPSIRKGTLAAVIRAEANSNAMVAGDGPTLGWPGWSTKATKQKTRTEYAGGASIGQGNVAWMDVSGRFVPPAGASRSVTRAQRPSSASQSLQNWPAVNWNTSRGRTASTTSQMSDRDTEKMRASPPKEDPSAAQDLGDGAEAAPQVEDVTAGEMPAEEPAQGPSSTGAEGMETVEEEPEEDAAKESHVQWLRLRMENTANFGSEADRITLFELLQMLAVKDAHKEEVLDNIGLGGPIKHLDTVYLRGHTGLWMFVKNGTQLTCNSDDRTKSTAFVVEFKGGSTLKVDCLEARYAGQRPFLF
eukprot:s1112_g10.t3